MKVWDRTGIELATPGYAVRHASVARHVTDCANLSWSLYNLNHQGLVQYVHLFFAFPFVAWLPLQEQTVHLLEYCKKI